VKTLFLAAGVIAMSLTSTTNLFAGKYTSAVAAAGEMQGRILWCDADANVSALDSYEKISELVEQCRKANITTIVMDVKSLSGIVLYQSKIAPRLKEWKGRQYPADFDPLAAAIEEGHKAGIEVYAAVNVFSEGRQGGDKRAAAFVNPDWQCMHYDIERWAGSPDENGYPISAVNRLPLPGRLGLITKNITPTEDMTADIWVAAVGEDWKVRSSGLNKTALLSSVPEGCFLLVGSGEAGEWLRERSSVGSVIELVSKPKLVPVGISADEHQAVFVNPANPQARAYEISIIEEIVKNYNVDGIVLDRMRYPGIRADFSDLSRSLFESWLGRKVENFPEDIFTIDPISGSQIIRGKLFGSWMQWRAMQIRSFVAEVRSAVKKIRPDAKVAAYVGSWYDSYYEVGVNWASPKYVPNYDFADANYRQTGYADLMDWICTGCYYKYPTRADARAAGAGEGGSVEAAAEQSNEVVDDDTFVYAGLYLLQYARDPEAFKRAVETACALTQGVMLFDLVYIRDYNWWSMLESIFQKPVKAPHSVPGLIDKAKELRRMAENQSKK